ncbi:Structural Maintenance Chromosome protein 2, SMC2 [Carpediemonas membranifera]|uniref:Structural Maintenance Chromosome protein 2, SMC2 n=1 Tax=Carpediemonas membranifera TaxID=201153 RepID=A0A8J6C097_9EUKA|nr:Structural Maintenance Chromosome protein 2, SMC2 [Carpediemonas membranifera]|eukprot:KAG9396351.1 Structural Maintenance Chromosome protein 2, SMC2 [Carpediemonas membranifera]
MHLTKVILDGFKSYSERTEVKGFDPQFNAITGFNGSGKSNILDGICFVMGLTDHGRMRVTNYQELIYKSGAQHVSSASVTLVFGGDPTTFPRPYQDREELTVTRKTILSGTSKYLINGKNATQKAVHDLFQSVGLNVNQPQFLVMQGKIAQILGMKPDQIMRLIEEAAGTRMYETKKAEVQKVFFQKEKKIAEIDLLLKEDIEPRLKQLNEQHAMYERQKEAREELGGLRKQVAVQTFLHAQKSAADAEESSAQAADNEARLQEQLERLETEYAEVSEQFDELSKNSDNEAIQKAQAKLNKAKSEAAAVAGRLQGVVANAKEAQANAAENEKKLGQLKATIASTRAELEKAEADKTSADTRLEEARTALAAITAARRAASSGVIILEGGQTCTKPQRIAQLGTMEADTVQAMGAVQDEVRLLQDAVEAAQEAMNAAEASRASKQSALDAARRALTDFEAEHGNRDALSRRLADVTRDIDSARDRANSATDGDSRDTVLFSYRKPRSPSFDPTKVHGALAELVEVLDEHIAAVEASGGARLFNVVSDNYDTAETLIREKCLDRRTTFLPLDRIGAKKIDPRLSEIINEKYGTPAVDSISKSAKSAGIPEKQFRKVVGHIWGDVVICHDQHLAAELAINRHCKDVPKNAQRPRTVTTDGQLFHPGGTMTGGQRSKKKSVFQNLAAMRRQREVLTRLMDELAELEAEREQLVKLIDTHAGLRRSVEDLTQDDFDSTTAELTRARSTLARREGEASVLEGRLQSIQDELRALQATGDDAESGELVSQREQALSVASKAQKKAERLFMGLTSELAAAEDELASLAASVADTDKQIEITASEVADLMATKTRLDIDVSKAQEETAALLDEAASRDQEVDSLGKTQRRLGKQVGQVKAQLTNAAESAKTAASNASITAKAMRQAEAALSKTRTKVPEDAEVMPDFAALQKHLGSLEETLGTEIDRSVITRSKTAQVEFDELKKRRETVLADKDKIEAVIVDLDGKKRVALEQTLTQVSEEFGVMLGIMLPGAGGRLDVVDNRDLSQGAEIRVSLGGAWKESLGELSGGQRSLCALALILSLLKIRPAPLYILDEIDAALDLNNTQNIGKLIKSRFGQAQFIVVSLKEAMFDNANVLFRVNFADGTSKVTRQSTV